MKHGIKAALAAAALVAALTGCTTGGTPAGPETGAQQPQQSASAAPAAPETSGTAEFGTTWAYDDGLGVKVTLAGPAVASQYASGAEATGGEMLLFDVEVTNGTKEAFDPALLTVDVNHGTAGAPAARVFDTAAGIGDHFQGTILPGGMQTVRMAFAIPTASPSDIVFTVSPDFIHEEAVFFGAAVLQ